MSRRGRRGATCRTTSSSKAFLKSELWGLVHLDHLSLLVSYSCRRSDHKRCIVLSRPGGAETMAKKFHGNVRSEVQVKFLALLASKPKFSFVGRKKRPDGPKLPTPPQHSAEPLAFCTRVLRNLYIVENLLKNPHTEPQRFCRTLGAKPSSSDPASQFTICTSQFTRLRYGKKQIHGNVRREVRVNFLALFASKPTSSCVVHSTCSDLFVRMNVHLNVGIPNLVALWKNPFLGLLP